MNFPLKSWMRGLFRYIDRKKKSGNRAGDRCRGPQRPAVGRRAAGRRQTRGRTGVCRTPRRLGLRETPSPPPAGLRAGAGHVPSVASLLGTIYKVAPKTAAPATQRGGRSGERSGGRGPGIRWTGSREPGDPIAAGRASWRFVAPDCSPQQGNDRETGQTPAAFIPNSLRLHRRATYTFPSDTGDSASLSQARFSRVSQVDQGSV